MKWVKICICNTTLKGPILSENWNFFTRYEEKSTFLIESKRHYFYKLDLLNSERVCTDEGINEHFILPSLVNSNLTLLGQ